MVTEKTMAIILAYAVPLINQNLSSVDFLNNHVQKIDGKTPFYDDMSAMNALDPAKSKHVMKRSNIHMKDSWSVNVSAKGDVGYVYLDNSKRTSDGRWKVADLIWKGTGPYQVFLPTVYAQTLVSAVPGVGQTQFPSLKQWRKYRTPEPVLQGHQSGKMSFYNRYTGHWNYNRTSRRGIRNEIVTSFHDYILLCVENGVRKAIEMMENEGLLIAKIKDVHVRIAK
jgi:hypothetical protein